MNSVQTSNHIFMIRPANFGYNEQTAQSNAFQSELSEPIESVQKTVLEEFDQAVSTLRSNGVVVDVFHDSVSPIKPDAIFPNNWVSLHADGTMVLYPMCTPNRRLERNQLIIDQFKKRLAISSEINLSTYEEQHQFLEGTGSIVFDHINRIAFACSSIRTDETLFRRICQELNYTPFLFDSVDQNGQAIYHTNVMMNIGPGFAVACLDSIQDIDQKKQFKRTFEQHNIELITISFDQMNAFAGNMICVKGKNEPLLVVSNTSYQVLSEDQKQRMSKYAKLLPISIPTIESIGGGSIRCMIAEIFTKSR